MAADTVTGARDRQDPRVDDYIAGLPDWQQAICRRVRDLFRAIIANNRAGGWRKLRQGAR